MWSKFFVGTGFYFDYIEFFVYSTRVFAGRGIGFMYIDFFVVWGGQIGAYSFLCMDFGQSKSPI